jgi:hypothetical protein
LVVAMAALHAVSDDFCPASPMPVLVLFEHVKFAQNDRRLGRAKILDPRCGGFAEPSTMLAAVGAVNFAGMWSFRWTNDADVAAARALPIEGRSSRTLRPISGDAGVCFGAGCNCVSNRLVIVLLLNAWEHCRRLAICCERAVAAILGIEGFEDTLVEMMQDVTDALPAVVD